MKRVNRLLLAAVFVLLTLWCCFASACNDETNYSGLNFGKYYLESSDAVYIEIKAEHKAYLHNLDFSDFDPEAYWGNDEEWESNSVNGEDVIVVLQGEIGYWYFDGGDGDDKSVFFEVKRCSNGMTYGISFIYNGTNQLEFEGEKYILKGDINMSNPIATIVMQSDKEMLTDIYPEKAQNNGKKILIELYPEKAPNTVNNFIALANSGFYDGLTFHRVISGFMIQGGDPAGVGTGGPGYTIRGEFALNGFKGNDIKHLRGVISMARANDPNSAGSQFFIMHADAAYLDGQYAAFGKVINGMETVDEIASVATDYNDKPRQAVVISTIRVDTFGVSYPEPAKAR